MKYNILAASVIMLLAGCVITPLPPAQQPVEYVPAPVIITYPTVESAYLWDPVIGCFFFVSRGNRYYMDRGWAYRTHGAPVGRFHGVITRHH